MDVNIQQDLQQWQRTESLQKFEIKIKSNILSYRAKLLLLFKE
jgi:hypothetical protein